VPQERLGLDVEPHKLTSALPSGGSHNSAEMSVLGLGGSEGGEIMQTGEKRRLTPEAIEIG
jgi:hypothetical protein